MLNSVKTNINKDCILKLREEEVVVEIVFKNSVASSIFNTSKTQKTNYGLRTRIKENYDNCCSCQSMSIFHLYFQFWSWLRVVNKVTPKSTYICKKLHKTTQHKKFNYKIQNKAKWTTIVHIHARKLKENMQNYM